MNQRGSGILLHITSLPSAYGIGDLGPEAYRFVDLLASAGQRYWQILPLNPTCPGFGNSPYQSTSAFAGNTWLISPEQMVADGLLDPGDIRDPPAFPEDRVDYRAIVDHKKGLFGRAFERFRERGPDFHYKEFAARNVTWLDDYAIFVALRERFAGKVWGDWPSDIRDRHQDALRTYGTELADRILEEKFLQYIFDRQWKSLKNHCRSRHIQIIGDLPIYLTYDSVDLWANPGLFKLDGQKKPAFVAGVPPDDFSATGQLWGNPVYNWEAHQMQGFAWWESRIDRTLALVDRVRLDHFRGFVQYWEVPAGETSAENGCWVDAPGRELFTLLARSRPCLPIIAEDLGHITPDVHEMMAHFGFPGMKVLIFGFSGDIAQNPHAPHSIREGCVAYTGTHDNNTIRGWFEHEVSGDQRNLVFRYIGGSFGAEHAHRIFIRLAMISPARTVIIPMQDILGLGGGP
ncbi:MAG: 4-alpha-glucanotransferase, partial [Methanoculleus sp.]